MAVSALIVSFLVGILFVVIWGILSYVASNGTEFKSFFLGGLANFVFFMGGYISSYLQQFTDTRIDENNTVLVEIANVKPATTVAVAIYVSISVLIAILILNVFHQGFCNSLARMEKIKSISFTSDGYRDIQIYAGGLIAILCGACILIYGLYLGSVRHNATYFSVLFGVSLSFGILGLLYVIFGAFFNYQIFNVLNVSAPEVLGTYGVLTKKLFGIAITSMIVIFCVIFLSTIIWSSIRIGDFVSRI